MALLKKFKDFLLRSNISQQDYIVGYDSNTGEEIRIKASSLQGAAGAGADIQFSIDGSSWHYPIQEQDLFIRIRVGNGEWNVARFATPQSGGSVGRMSYSSDSQNVVEESFENNITLHKVAKTGNYNDLRNKPSFSLEGLGVLGNNIEDYSTVEPDFSPESYILVRHGGQGWAKMELNQLIEFIIEMSR